MNGSQKTVAPVAGSRRRKPAWPSQKNSIIPRRGPPLLFERLPPRRCVQSRSNVRRVLAFVRDDQQKVVFRGALGAGGKVAAVVECGIVQAIQKGKHVLMRLLELGPKLSRRDFPS